MNELIARAENDLRRRRFTEAAFLIVGAGVFLLLVVPRLPVHGVRRLGGGLLLGFGLWLDMAATREWREAGAAIAAGRLGCVHREAPGTVDEPLAVYHVGSRFHACADRCPHAGATLSEGELEGGVVTCPRHGSQFDVATGQRVRGPADTDIATYPTVEDGGQLYLLVPD